MRRGMEPSRPMLPVSHLDVESANSNASRRRAYAAIRDYVQSLSGALGSFGKIARDGIRKSNELGDAVSADIFTEISRGVEKWLWMVEAHLQLQR